jgi:hypothetical protein
MNFGPTSASSSIRECCLASFRCISFESDSKLSKNLNNRDEPKPGLGDWYILIDGTQSELAKSDL